MEQRGGEDGEEGRWCEGGVGKALRMQAVEGKFARQRRKKAVH